MAASPMPAHSYKAHTWLVYSSRMQSSKVFLRDVSLLSTQALLLFGGRVQVGVSGGGAKEKKYLLAVADWARVRTDAASAGAVKRMRGVLDAWASRRLAGVVANLSHGKRGASDEKDDGDNAVAASPELDSGLVITAIMQLLVA
jgi:hypothetical protein